MRIERCTDYCHFGVQRIDDRLIRDYRAAEHIAVTGYVLGQAMYKDIDIELRVVVYACQCIVEQRQSTMLPGKCRNERDVRDFEDGIGWTFEYDQTRCGTSQSAFDAINVVDR